MYFAIPSTTTVGDLFGQARAFDLVRAHRSQLAGETIARLYEAVQAYARPSDNTGAMTTAAIKVD
jgi:hypothetical protein